MEPVMPDAPSAPSAVYPTELAGLVSDIFQRWDDEGNLDMEYQECLNEGWTLAEFVALCLIRLPVEQRMEAMGMVEVGYRARMKDQTRCWTEADRG